MRRNRKEITVDQIINGLPDPVWCWVIVAVIMLVVESLTLNLTTIWLAGGAFAAALVSFATDSMVWQLLVFAVVSLLLIIVTRPLVVEKVNRKAVPTNFDALIGKTAVAISDIDDMQFGDVKADGKVWTAVPVKGTPVIKEGDKVKIIGIEGVKLIVEKEENI